MVNLPLDGLINQLICLVVWKMAFIFPYIGHVIISTDELIFFSGVAGQPPTSQYQPVICANVRHRKEF
jgi:hypothetical protein